MQVPFVSSGNSTLTRPSPPGGCRCSRSVSAGTRHCAWRMGNLRPYERKSGMEREAHIHIFDHVWENVPDVRGVQARGKLCVCGGGRRGGPVAWLFLIVVGSWHMLSARGS